MEAIAQVIQLTTHVIITFHTNGMASHILCIILIKRKAFPVITKALYIRLLDKERDRFFYWL